LNHRLLKLELADELKLADVNNFHISIQFEPSLRVSKFPATRKPAETMKTRNLNCQIADDEAKTEVS
jgi:hypothetical protein